jgi:endo-1,4-beta-xylanase
MKRSLQAAAFVLAAVGVIVALVLLRQTNAPTVLPEPSLKVLAARHGIELGNFAILKHLGDPDYTRILTDEFSLATIDNVPNWHFTDHDLRPGPNQYDYKQVDAVVDFAKANGMTMQAHHFVWGEQKWLPDWLLNGKYSKQQLMDLMKDHILNVGARYRGSVSQWTVVNEAHSRQAGLFGLRDWWADNTGGTEYIDQAFIWARQADPDAVLILNDFNNEAYNDVSNAMYDYIKGAKARGVPIDGIGMQMHIDGAHPPNKDEVISNMRRFADLGVGIYVTELDVNMNDLPVSGAAKDAIQGNIYYELVRACIESKVCHSFALLGITDGETWYNYLDGVRDARPLPFDADYKPKPAYWGMRNALEQPHR